MATTTLGLCTLGLMSIGNATTESIYLRQLRTMQAAPSATNGQGSSHNKPMSVSRITGPHEYNLLHHKASKTVAHRMVSNPRTHQLSDRKLVYPNGSPFEAEDVPTFPARACIAIFTMVAFTALWFKNSKRNLVRATQMALTPLDLPSANVTVSMAFGADMVPYPGGSGHGKQEEEYIMAMLALVANQEVGTGIDEGVCIGVLPRRKRKGREGKEFRISLFTTLCSLLHLATLQLPHEQ